MTAATIRKPQAADIDQRRNLIGNNEKRDCSHSRKAEAERQRHESNDPADILQAKIPSLV